MSEHRRRERRNFDRCRRIEFVAVDVHFIIKTPEREESEVREHHEQVHQLRHFSHHDHPQREQHHSSEDERDPFEFREVIVDQRTHTDVMIQGIDPNEDKSYITGTYEYPLGRGINFQIDTDNVQKLADLLKQNSYDLRRDIWDSWYRAGSVLHGCRQILVLDPDGYLLRFSQDIGEKSVS